MTTDVYVLCAGESSRLFPFSSVTPKPLLPVGDRPFVRWIVDWIDGTKNDVALCCNSKDAMRFAWEFRLETRVYFLTSASPQGTAGELVRLKHNKQRPYQFVVWYGDVLIDRDVNWLLKENDGFDVALVLYSKVPTEYGVPTVEDGLVTRFVEKSPYRELIWTGVAAFKTESVLPYLKPGADFGRDVFPAMVRDGKRIHACMATDYVDIGTWTNYQRANEAATEGTGLWAKLKPKPASRV